MVEAKESMLEAVAGVGGGGRGVGGYCNAYDACSTFIPITPIKTSSIYRSDANKQKAGIPRVYTRTKHAEPPPP